MLTLKLLQKPPQVRIKHILQFVKCVHYIADFCRTVAGLRSIDDGAAVFLWVGDSRQGVRRSGLRGVAN